MTVSPELANTLSKRWNETVAEAPMETNHFSKSASGPRVEESGVSKPVLHLRASKNSEIAPKPFRSGSNAYENVTLRSRVCGNETSLPATFHQSCKDLPATASPKIASREREHCM